MGNSNKQSLSHEKHLSLNDSCDAIVYQSLFLMNLLLIPGLSFMMLTWFFVRRKNNKGWQRIHLYRSVQLSVLSCFFLIIIPVTILSTTHTFDVSLMLIIIYFVTMHAAFVLLGMLNISRAMAKKLPLF